MMEGVDEKERLAQKDAYIAEHLMCLQPDTLRFLVADLEFHTRKLTALCDEYRGEAERLKYWDSFLCPRCHGVGEITVMSGQTPENFSQDNIPCPDCVGPIIDERDAAVSALTRARAEGTELAAQIVDSWSQAPGFFGCSDVHYREVASAIRLAAKGENDGA